MFLNRWLWAGFGLLLLPLSLSADEAKVQFNRDIRPILSNHCFHCHGPSEEDRAADLRLDQREAAIADLGGYHAIQPGNRNKSELWSRVTSDDEFTQMPPPETKKELTKAEIELLGKWIDQGAEYQSHWSFIPPQKPKVPEVTHDDLVKNPIDAFVFKRLEQAGLKPAAEADRETLLRRVTFDLTGLPPTLEEIDAFVNDDSPNAYEKVVDRLLQSPAFGERMALAWMDAARYGDTSVFHADGPREMWIWRDWVIDAYNNNKPFDEFTVEQLAGDLLPEPTLDQLVATAFNRNHGTTDEGGAIAEEYRVEYVVDRVKTTATVWMGLTMECGQCHDHKYDPISQKDYYEFYAFFNTTADRGMQTRRGNAEPKIDIPNRAAEPRLKELDKLMAEANAKLSQRAKAVEPEFQQWLAKQTENADSANLLPTGEVAGYPLNDSKGKQVANTANADKPGHIKGGNPKWIEGQVGGALELDGRTFVDLGDVADFERDQAFSYGAWIYAETPNGAPIAKMDDGNQHRGFDLFMAGGAVAAHFIHQWPSNALKVTTKAKLPLKKWQHVFVTYDGSGKAAGVKIYFNGKEQPWNIEQNCLSKSIRTKKPLYLGQRSGSSQFKGKLDEVRVYPRALSAAEVQALAGQDPIKPLLAIKPEERTPEQRKTLRNHYLQQFDEPTKQLRKELAQFRKEHAELSKPLTSVMIMKEMPNPRATYILERGHYASPNKEEVIQPSTPESILPFGDRPKNRLGLAQWLTDPNHPLTARVAVNRYWQMLFGTGIVETMEDFGSQGSWPSHPDLLDWLAVDFVESDWDIKRKLKQIVMSHTYRQSSKVTRELHERDPENRLLARGPRFRLQAEFVRDQALAVSGLLVDQVGGPGVKPYQPPGLWNEVSLSGNVRFVQDHGDKLYRKSMYTYWKRSAPAPSMLIFDAPTREACTVRRPRTNTPLQALVTLNDPQFVEASRKLAARMLLEGGNSVADRVTFAYRLATGKRPSEATLQVLRETFEQELARFERDRERANALLSVGESERNQEFDAAEHAAYTILASMILNLDATLTRG